MVSLTGSPGHQPHQLIEGDTPVTVLVHLPHQLPQLPLGGAPAECPHDLAQLHRGDGAAAVPAHTTQVNLSTNVMPQA